MWCMGAFYAYVLNLGHGRDVECRMFSDRIRKALFPAILAFKTKHCVIPAVLCT